MLSKKKFPLTIRWFSLLSIFWLLSGCAGINPVNWFEGNTQLEKRAACAKGHTKCIGKSTNFVLDELGQPEYTQSKDRGQTQVWEFIYYKPPTKAPGGERKTMAITFKDGVVVRIESPDLKEPKVLKPKHKANKT